MPLRDYMMIRHSTQLLYTFELLVALAVAVLVLERWRRAGDAPSLVAYLVGGLYGSAVELVAQGSGVRVIGEARLFGAVPVGFPVLPFVLGFFEGGVLLLVGSWIVRAALAREPAALRLALGVVGAVLVPTALGAAWMHGTLRGDPGALTVTTRALGAPGALGTLALCYGLALCYAAIGRGASPEARRALAVWYLGIAAVGAVWYTPPLLAGIRFVGTMRDGVAVAAGPLEQVAVFYGFSLVFEAAGFYLPVFVLLHAMGLFGDASRRRPAPA